MSSSVEIFVPINVFSMCFVAPRHIHQSRESIEKHSQPREIRHQEPPEVIQPVELQEKPAVKILPNGEIIERVVSMSPTCEAGMDRQPEFRNSQERRAALEDLIGQLEVANETDAMAGRIGRQNSDRSEPGE